jgi:hypothetical protein
MEKIIKVDKPLANKTKWNRGNIQINKIRGEKGVIMTNKNKIQTIISYYFDNLYSRKLE